MSLAWDTLKAAANLQKHGVSFEEARIVFRDPLALTFGDSAHSDQESREIIVGHSDRNRLLFVCFLESSEGVRLISARRPTRRNQKKYEDTTSF